MRYVVSNQILSAALGFQIWSRVREWRFPAASTVQIQEAQTDKGTYQL